MDVSPNHSFYIGVELSEKFFSYCLIDNKGSLLEQKIIPYNQLMSETNLTETLFIEELYLFIKQCSAYQPKSIEIALFIYVKNIVVHPDSELCKCGKRGCLQTYTSESWIIKKSQILFDNSDSSYLRQLAANRSHLTIETILQAYKLGDEGVTNILHNAIKYLSITLNNLSMMIAMDKLFRVIIYGNSTC